MFYLEDKPTALDEKRNFTEKAVYSGHQSGFYDLSVKGRLSIFSISLKPQGAMKFYNIPLREFCDRNIPLKYFTGDGIDKLEEKLCEAKSFNEKVHTAEKYLLNELSRNINEYDFNRVDHCVRLVNQAGGYIDINNLASEACLSRKQFERIFLRYIGISPKKFLRTVRLQKSLHLKSNNYFPELAALAYECGYSDQAHMVNDFKALTGLTPGRFFSECEPRSDYFG
jgi:AraC-like DNA-binding protein